MGKFCVRRTLKSGAKFGLVIGYDLTKEEHQKEILRYTEVHHFLVVIFPALPPCTSFGHWVHFGQVLHPKIWQQSRRIDVRLATFAAKLCVLQMQCGRYRLLGNPASSDMFSLTCFKSLWDIGKVVSINVPQCTLGLQFVRATHIHKHGVNNT